MFLFFCGHGACLITDNGIQQESVVALSAVAEASLRKTLWRILPVAAIVIGLMLLCHFSPLRSYLGNVQQFKAFIATTGGWGPVTLILLGSISVAIGFPRTALSIIAGMLFGVVWGLLIGHVAAMCGTCLTFYGARLCRTEWLLSHCRNRYIQALLQRQPGTLTVILIRQLPVPGIAQNIALSLTRISHRSFLLGSAVGMLPVSLLFTLIGAGIGKASALQAFIPPASALLAALIGLIWFKNKRKPSGTVPQ